VGALQPIHLLLILVIVLIIFGAGKLPDTFRDIGRGVRSLRDEAGGKGTAGTTAGGDSSVSSQAAVTCKSCGTVAAAGAKFCARCGQAL
jgi:sec-independent protein translocase protein TatA